MLIIATRHTLPPYTLIRENVSIVRASIEAAIILLTFDETKPRSAVWKPSFELGSKELGSVQLNERCYREYAQALMRKIGDPSCVVLNPYLCELSHEFAIVMGSSSRSPYIVIEALPFEKEEDHP